jgi:hypothetical protein
MSLKKRGHIYLKAASALAAYFIVGNIILIKAILSDNILLSYGAPFVYGVMASILFLFIFSHEDFFKFAKEIEKKEERAEKRWLKIFSQTGKVVSTIGIGTIGGPILSALTARLLLNRKPYKYLLVALISIPSTILYVSVYLGAFSFVK